MHACGDTDIFWFLVQNARKSIFDAPLQMFNTPMVLGKFSYLKYLEIELPATRHNSVLEYSDCNSFHPRHLSQNSHDNLQNVMITGFCSAKSMIELTNHILENAPSLECLTSDTSRGHEREIHKSSMCLHMFEEDLVEVQRARVAIAQYVARKGPPTVNLKVVEPCSKCLS